MGTPVSEKKSQNSGTTPKNEEPPVSAISKLAHEIKNPLTAILGFTTIMRDESKENVTMKQMREWAQIIHEASIGLAKTCERVLDEENSSSSIVKKEDIDFSTLGETIVTLFQSEAKSQGVALTFNISDNFPILHTDPVLLTEMLNNLISNAIKFTPRGGKVHVKGEVDANSNALIILVQDTGEGIPADILMAIQRGEQVTMSSDKSKYKGWGVGIRIVSENARKLGCDFKLYCPKNKGTVACLTFPGMAG
jgi:signal transduction histidine kinase